MPRQIKIVIPGVPKGQPRPRATAFETKGGKLGARVYNPQGGAAQFKADLKKFVFDTPGFPYAAQGEKVRVDWKAYFTRPKRLLRKKDPDGPVPYLSTPDVDNIAKTIMDALNGVAWEDDRQVWKGRMEKLYCSKPGSGIDYERPCVEITFYFFKEGQNE